MVIAEELSELRANWRPLLAATFGMGTGFSLIGYINSAIGPELIRTNGWSMADFAMIASLSIVSAAALPAVGRLTDKFGVRSTALIGLIALPLGYFLYSRMTGQVAQYVVIYLFQASLCVATTATVYTRLVVQAIHRARGLALAITTSGPALVGIAFAPFLNDYVGRHGWRDTYQMLTLLALTTGLITFALIPAKSTKAAARPTKPHEPVKYGQIFRRAAFWVLLAAMLLCNLPQVIVMSQLKLMLIANHLDASSVSLMFTLLSCGMLGGRLLTGFLIDRFPPELVAAACLGLPSAGLFIFAGGASGPWSLGLAVLTLGFGFGAEGDALAYLVARNFGLAVYSSVMGLMGTAIAVSASLGAMLLGVTLGRTGNFVPFLTISGSAVFTGACLLALFGKHSREIDPAPLLGHPASG